MSDSATDPEVLADNPLETDAVSAAAQPARGDTDEHVAGDGSAGYADAPEDETDSPAESDEDDDAEPDEAADDADDDDSDDEDDDADDEDDEDDDAEDDAEPQPRTRSAKLEALDEEGDIAADYLEELLDIADLDGDIDTFTEGGRAHVSIVTDATVLVGKDGEVLEALQDLCRLAVMTETGKRSRLMLDIAGHREKRRRELTDLASDAVQEAKDSGEPVRLSPMNPFERKVVHDIVAAAGLVSESEGEEPNRRVVVQPV